ncbi:MAG: serine protease [Planctomycetota bacterium]|nr:serine protease [Planctomycetota bacterium]
MLTAAHCVLSDDGKLTTGELLVEIAPPARAVQERGIKSAETYDEARQGGSEKTAPTLVGSTQDHAAALNELARYDGIWAKCEVIALDREHDLCLLRCAADVPVLSKLDPQADEPAPGAELMVVGCPRGVSPKASSGTLKQKETPECSRFWRAEADFDHGNSGGPVYRKDDGRFLGVAVAGVPDTQGRFDPHVALFVPQRTVFEFVKRNLPRP